MHAIEYDWLELMRAARLFAYRLPADPFVALGHPRPHAFVSTEPVEPLDTPEPVGDLLELHRAPGIQLRLMDNLWVFRDAVIASCLAYSGIRLRNAQPRSRAEVNSPPGRAAGC